MKHDFYHKLAFSHPTEKHERKHGPKGYTDPKSFRPWLRDEFNYRCAFCLLRERWQPDTQSFTVEHEKPKSIPEFRHLKCIYDNLLYACSRCNTLKGTRTKVPTPCTVGFGRHIDLDSSNGLFVSQSDEGTLIIKLYRLNEPKRVAFRNFILSAITNVIATDESKMEPVLGYPEDLPDLDLLKLKGGNDRPTGVSQSALSLKREGKLPAVY